MSFLNAEWRKLAFFNYQVDPSILKNYVPKGTEIDLWQGNCYVSVVGFMFMNTKILGLKIPMHVNFEEVNLRFYVKRKSGDEWKRGVVFVKEIVPKPALSFVANTVYKEHYETRKMDHSWQLNNGTLDVEYRWKVADKWQSVSISAASTPVAIEPQSEAEFITEHYWGYAKVSEEKTNEYEVTHPKWLQYPILDFKTDFDFGLNYGDAFRFLNQVEPSSIQLAEGSQITVEGKKTLR